MIRAHSRPRITVLYFVASITSTAVQHTIAKFHCLNEILSKFADANRCKTFRTKYESCNKLLYKLTLSPAVRFAAFALLMQYKLFTVYFVNYT